MRLNRLPTLSILCAIVIMAIALAGCTSVAPSAPAGAAESSSGTAAQSASAEPTSLDVYTWWDITNFAHLQQMQATFEEQNPAIKLNFITIPTDYANTMVTKLAAGEIPDVMMLAMDQVPRYANAGLLTPIADLASQEYIDSLYPVVKNALTVDGTMYAAGRDVTPKVMYLNTAMFEAAGIPIPDETWTIDDFLALAQQLTTGTGVDEQWGYYWANFPDQTFALIAAFGGHMYSDDGTHSVLSTDEKSMQALQFMYDLYNTYDVAPTAAEATQFGTGEYAPFMANKVAMQIGSLSTASALDAAGAQYTVLPIPYIDGVSQTSSFVNTWTIPANAEHADLSWRVVEFLSGKEGQQIALDMKFGLPASTLVDTSEFEAATPYNKYYVQALEAAVPYPVHPNGSPFQQLFITEAEKLWAGVSTPEQFAATMDEASVELLNPEQ